MFVFSPFDVYPFLFFVSRPVSGYFVPATPADLPAVCVADLPAGSVAGLSPSKTSFFLTTTAFSFQL